MSIMYCNSCHSTYGPTLLTCPNCGSGDVARAVVEVSPEAEELISSTSLQANMVPLSELAKSAAKDNLNGGK